MDLKHSILRFSLHQFHVRSVRIPSQSEHDDERRLSHLREHVFGKESATRLRADAVHACRDVHKTVQRIYAWTKLAHVSRHGGESTRKTTVGE